jgi:hypothetical protein
MKSPSLRTRRRSGASPWCRAAVARSSAAVVRQIARRSHRRDHRGRAEEAGFRLFLEKPVAVDELTKKLAELA